MNFSKRYKLLEIITVNSELYANFEQYENPRILYPKENISLNEKELWELDRGYFNYITKKQNEGMWAFSPKSISLLKTHDELHKGFLEMRREKDEQGIALDVEVKFM